MQGFLEFPDEPTRLFSADCDVSRKNFEPYVNSEESKKVSVSCNNTLGQRIITCKHPFIQEFIDEVNGLSFNQTLSSKIVEIPFYIPILDYGISSWGTIPDTIETVGITIGDLISSGVKQVAGSYHEQKHITFRNSILNTPSFKNKRCIAFLSGIDTLIEHLWHQRDKCLLFDTIKKMAFWAATGINFSVIEGECPFAHHLNQKKSLLSASLIEKSNIYSIPHIYAINEYHAQKWIDWFSLNPSINTFTINCQLQKSRIDILMITEVVTKILTAHPNLHVILQGFKTQYLWYLEDVIERVHIAEKLPTKFAQMRLKIFVECHTKKQYFVQDFTTSKQEILRINLKARLSYLEFLKNSILKKKYLKV